AGEAPLDLWARGLDQLVKLYSRRTGRHAGHAAEAVVDVLDEVLGHADLTMRGHLHQLDAPARRVHLLTPKQVCRASRQAEAAVHTVRDELGIGRVVLVEGTQEAICGSRAERECGVIVTVSDLGVVHRLDTSHEAAWIQRRLRIESL